MTIDTLAPPSTMPPLPRLSPTPVRAPGAWAALGWIALYFAAQAVGSGVIAVIMAVAIGAFRTWLDLTRAGDIIRAMLNRPGMQGLLVILTLTLAASVVVLLVQRRCSGDLDERMEAVIETHHGRLIVRPGSGENQAGFGKGRCHWLLKIECFVRIENRNGVVGVLSAGRSHQNRIELWKGQQLFDG